MVALEIDQQDPGLTSSLKSSHARLGSLCLMEKTDVVVVTAEIPTVHLEGCDNPSDEDDTLIEGATILSSSDNTLLEHTTTNPSSDTNWFGPFDAKGIQRCP